MKLKHNVNFPLNVHMFVLAKAFDETHPMRCVTVTSGKEQMTKHMVGSLHYKSFALDFRVYDVPGYDYTSDEMFEQTRRYIDDWIDRAKSRLKSLCKDFHLNPNHYQIIFGDKNHRNHIHAEYDEK